ncbi:hypothetical protein OXX69_008411 [Metschnikowia pulcherrima]
MCHTLAVSHALFVSSPRHQHSAESRNKCLKIRDLFFIMKSILAQVPSFKDSRLPSLFSDFSNLKETNPDGYEANVSAWEELLLKCLRLHTFDSSVALPAASLSASLEHPLYGKPKSLGLVLSGLIEQRALVPWSVFKAEYIAPFSQYTDFAYPSRVWSSIRSSWKFSRYSPDLARSDSTEYYIHMPTLEDLAPRLYKSLKGQVTSRGSYVAGILDFEMFSTLIKELDNTLSDVDIQAIHIYLSRDKRLMSSRTLPGHEKSHHGELIKISDEKTITNEDIDILNVKVNIRDIENRVAALELTLNEEIPQQIKKMLDSKASGNRLKSLLRRKAQLAKSLESATSVLNELHVLLDKIDEAQSHGTIFTSLQSANAVLSAFNKRVSLVELHDLNAEISEQMALTDDISDALGESESWNEDDIEKEMERLEIEVTETTAKEFSETEISSKHVERESSDSAKQQPNGSSGSQIDKMLMTKLENLSVNRDRPESPEKKVASMENEQEHAESSLPA